MKTGDIISPKLDSFVNAARLHDDSLIIFANRSLLRKPVVKLLILDANFRWHGVYWFLVLDMNRNEKYIIEPDVVKNYCEVAVEM